MQRIIRPLVLLVLVFELCSHGETKTIVFNSYSNGPDSEASVHKAQNDSTNGGVTRQQQASESSGRGFPSGGGSGFPFAIHPDYLSKPVSVARTPDTGYKTPKYIVYPSYSQSIRNSEPNYYNNAPVAMDRFAPGEAYGGTLYKLKKQKQGVSPGVAASFASIPAASFNSPVSVQSPNLLRPAASDNSPVTILAPPGGSSDGQSGPPSSPPSPPSAAGGPPSQSFFVPTPVPNSGEDTPPPSHSTNAPAADAMMDDSSEVVLFPPNSHSGHIPPQLKNRPIKGYLPPASMTSPSESSSGKAVTPPPVDLFKFPPNINSSYLPPGEDRPKNPVTSYIPPPSGETDSRSNAVPSQPSPSYNGTAELFSFPPNVNSSYLPPGAVDAFKHSATSYLPPPSGDPRSPSNLKPAEDVASTSATSGGTRELYQFLPNVNSNYLPPSGAKPSDPSATSYLPPPSGDPMSQANLQPEHPSGSPQSGSGGANGHAMSDELYKFPPNIHTGYLPSKEPAQNPVTSYLPPPSGSPHAPAYLNPSAPPAHPPQSPHSYMSPGDLYKFPPNVHSQYLPPYHSVPRPNNAVTSYLPPASGIPGDDAIGTIPVGPGKPQYLPPRYPDSGPPPMQPAPMAPMKMPPMMQQMMSGPPMDAPMDGPPTGPSGMGDEHHHHDHDHDHDHHHDHHHDHDFPYFTGFGHDHYPDIIYDHDHFHHHDEPTTTPPPPPPPPAPETPRLKNYSYYYLSRTLWYVPLYFTLYFTLYVAILIIRSIARHKVNLPNQWVGNGRSFASIRDLSDAEAQRKATMMATFTMKQIEDFREKYL